jgi:hypothetical protein
MSFIIWPEVLIAIVLVAILARVCTSARQFVSEETAHSDALDRKRSGGRRRSAHQSVMVLGGAAGENPCQVISVSRRTIRIHSSRALPAESQLQVEQGEDCFVCGIRKVAAADNGYNLELNVLASNYCHTSISGVLWERTWQAAGLGLRRLGIGRGRSSRRSQPHGD